MKNDIAIAPLPPQFLARVRQQGLDDLGQPVQRLVSTEGGEPLRDVLRRARPGEELILASFSPFSQVGPYREFGPIFVLANEEPAAPVHALPLDGYLRQQFVIRAYSEDEHILGASMTTPAEAGEVVDQFLARPDVAFLHVRFPTYGCFACRIDRANFS